MNVVAIFVWVVGISVIGSITLNHLYIHAPPAKQFPEPDYQTVVINICESPKAQVITLGLLRHLLRPWNNIGTVGGLFVAEGRWHSVHFSEKTPKPTETKENGPARNRRLVLDDYHRSICLSSSWLCIPLSDPNQGFLSLQKPVTTVISDCTMHSFVRPLSAAHLVVFLWQTTVKNSLPTGQDFEEALRRKLGMPKNPMQIPPYRKCIERDGQEGEVFQRQHLAKQCLTIDATTHASYFLCVNNVCFYLLILKLLFNGR